MEGVQGSFIDGTRGIFRSREKLVKGAEGRNEKGEYNRRQKRGKKKGVGIGLWFYGRKVV